VDELSITPPRDQVPRPVTRQERYPAAAGQGPRRSYRRRASRAGVDLEQPVETVAQAGNAPVAQPEHHPVRGQHGERVGGVEE
jgi:hypothetical protein